MPKSNSKQRDQRYKAPRLTVFGDVVSLTAGGSKPTGESGQNGKKN